jgi:hypothetical protein
MSNKKDLYEIFLDPETKYRPIPFWSWNDDLQEDELRRQIIEMKEKGFGGYFMHSRPGLKIPYLKERWMELIDFAIKEGVKVGLEPWLYDEDKWPSGFGSGEIPLKYPETRFRYLICVKQNDYDKILERGNKTNKKESHTNRMLIENLTNENLIATNEIDGNKFLFFEWIAPLGDKWYNNTCYTDLMNPETVDIFINYVYEEYKKKFAPLFGNEVPGIFTDEPCFYYWAKIPFPRVPWTKNFLSRFKTKNGYDLKDHLFALFEDLGDYKKYRYDYYKTISEFFLESYAKKLHLWCKENNLIFTGHYQMEDNLQQQIDAVGSMMPLYEYEDYPGIDVLGDEIDVIATYLTIKQCSSVADQLAKKRAMSESFGGAGWHFSIDNQKRMIELQLALGINYFVPHLLLYSLLGERKRDHPPSVYYQQPYWDQYKIFNDYISRLSAILSQGKRELNILIIHPIESAWLEYKPYNCDTVKQRDKELHKITKILLENQKDFHFGDESLIAKYGKVENGKFLVGEMSYDYVVLPDLLTVRETTYNLLQKFSEQEGNLIAINNFPKYVGHEEMKKSKIKFISITEAELITKLHELLPQKVSILGSKADKILVHHRKTDKQDIIYIVNIANENRDVTLILDSNHKGVEIWNQINGEKNIPQYEIKENKIFIPLKMHSGESFLFVTQDVQDTKANLPIILNEEVKEIVPIVGHWKMQSMSPNCLTLDYCQYRTEGDGYSRILPVLEVQNIIKDMNGQKINLKYIFELSDTGKFLETMWLVAEYNEDVVIKLNGEKLDFNKNDWWIDISFKKARINKLLSNGINYIEYETVIKEDTELESMYIIGEFYLKSNLDKIFTIVEQERNVDIFDLTKVGYQFFTGKMLLSKQITIDKKSYQKVCFNINKLDAMFLNLTVNDCKAGTIGWNPMEIDITKYIRQGNNNLVIELVSSCRNALGPHHLVRPEPKFINPNSFYDKEKWDNQYYFLPFGIPELPKILFY